MSNPLVAQYCHRPCPTINQTSKRQQQQKDSKPFPSTHACALWQPDMAIFDPDSHFGAWNVPRRSCGLVLSPTYYAVRQELVMSQGAELQRRFQGHFFMEVVHHFWWSPSAVGLAQARGSVSVWVFGTPFCAWREPRLSSNVTLDHGGHKFILTPYKAAARPCAQFAPFRLPAREACTPPPPPFPPPAPPPPPHRYGPPTGGGLEKSDYPQGGMPYAE